jgi:hypothetical protein
MGSLIKFQTRGENKMEVFGLVMMGIFTLGMAKWG